MILNSFNPLVSIIIPVFNGSNYMQSAIDSALDQDYDNIEVIVVNDGSKDNTEEIAKSYGDKIRYFSKENGGVATALNLAIEKSNGEYISWLSHDDYYLPNKVSSQVKELSYINKRDKIIIFSSEENHYIQNENITVKRSNILNLIHSGQLTKVESLKLLFLRVINGCTLLIPKNAFLTAGYFDKTLLTTQDYDLWFKFIKEGYTFFYLPEYLMVSRQHEQQDSIKKYDLGISEKKKMFNSNYIIFKEDINNADKNDKILIKNNLKEFKSHYIIFSKFKKKIKQCIKNIKNNHN